MTNTTPPAALPSRSTPGNVETRDMLLNVGPAHPAMHGIIRIVATLDGEQIVGADVEIGYLHRGFEKMPETVDYNGVIPYTDRLNYVSPLINNVGFILAIERLCGIEVTRDYQGCVVGPVISRMKFSHIVDGRVPHAVLLEIFTDAGVGTELVL